MCIRDRLAGDHTVLVIEHDMEFIRRLESQVTVLHQGHVLCEGTMDQVHHLMEIVNLQHRADWMAGSLSHGQKQWLEIAMLVGQDPDLLLVDEPVAGLTDEETDLTADLLKSLAGEHTVLVIEHDMEFIRRLNSPVTVLHQGHVLCEGSMDQIQQDPQVIEVYLGTQEEM